MLRFGISFVELDIDGHRKELLVHLQEHPEVFLQESIEQLTRLEIADLVGNSMEMCFRDFPVDMRGKAEAHGHFYRNVSEGEDRKLYFLNDALTKRHITYQNAQGDVPEWVKTIWKRH